MLTCEFVLCLRDVGRLVLGRSVRGQVSEEKQACLVVMCLVSVK